MSLRPLASLAIKMLGLYVILSALPGISNVLTTLTISRAYSVGAGSSVPSPTSLALAHLAGVALLMSVGLGVWWSSEGIARLAVREDGLVPVRRDEGLMAIGFSVVGVYLLAECVVQLTKFAINYYTVSRFYADLNVTTSGYQDFHIGIGDFLPIVVRGILALYLLLGARGLVRGLASFRNVGRDDLGREAELESEV